MASREGMRLHAMRGGKRIDARARRSGISGGNGVYDSEKLICIDTPMYRRNACHVRILHQLMVATAPEASASLACIETTFIFENFDQARRIGRAHLEHTRGELLAGNVPKILIPVRRKAF